MLDARRRIADQKRKEVLKLNDKVVLTLLDVARFLSRQSLDFQRNATSEGNFVAAVNMMRRRDPVLDRWFKDCSLRPYHSNYLHHNSQNEFIELLGSAVLKSIISDINDAPFISVMTNSTMDASHKEIYTIVVRFVKNFMVQERIITVVELNSKVGQDICEHILEQLKNCGIPTEKVIAQSYDNASNMSGKNMGVQACLKIMNTLNKLSGCNIETNTGETAKNLLNKLCSFNFYTILLFFLNLMASTNTLIIHLQKPEMDILATIDIIGDTIHLLQRMYNDDMALNAIIEPLPLGLLQNDRSTLTTNEWTLLSNFLHAFDEQKSYTRIRTSLNDLCSLPPKLRLKPSEIVNLLRELYGSVGPLMERSSDFHSLSVNTRQVLVKHNLYITCVMNGLFLCRELNVFDNMAVFNSYNQLSGPEYMIECRRNIAQFDSNGTIIKIFIFIIAFSSNYSIVTYDKQVDISIISNSINLVAIQNVYVTMLWKYLIYFYGFREAILRFTRLVKNSLNLITMVNSMPRNETRNRMRDKILMDTQRTLVIDG
ncbi:unnamed protein product [Rotaria sp. Silwood2]|nr:unnamed protein product [Rotaria sp. Silwood2]CAF2764773.1 unnamed protein product [Rotaria sp. Silwood2]CAF2897987.1 unnamed protein product [Rotaria sp. Silwood2]CAF3436405.1 unnamed protein product [Rotaria sp. Silwood2]CAF3890501.1 unnamed protein product [Rotaria sp. Silwood2]